VERMGEHQQTKAYGKAKWGWEKALHVGRFNTFERIAEAYLTKDQKKDQDMKKDACNHLALPCNLITAASRVYYENAFEVWEYPSLFNCI
jgi:hypothetical protein